MVKIIPSILTNNPQELKDMINVIEEKVDRVSIDIIDGVFTNNKTVDPSALNFIETNMKIDFQLMVKEPVNWVEKCFRAQADRIIGHIEMMSSQKEFITKVQSLGVKVGLALDIDTPCESLDGTLMNDLDVILLMSYKAGFGGQEFNDSVLEKIEKLDKLRLEDNTPYLIHVDGGINPETIKKVVRAKADEVSIGRSLFNGRIEGNIRMLLQSTEGIS